MTLLVWLYLLPFVIAVGIGGMRLCSSFGTDQLADANGWRKILLSRLVNIANIVAVTLILSMQTSSSWLVGFLLPAGLMILGKLIFLIGSSIYIKLPGRIILTSLVRVVCAAFTRSVVQTLVHGSLPQSQETDWYLYLENSSLLVPSNKLRFLNKAVLRTHIPTTKEYAMWKNLNLCSEFFPSRCVASYFPWPNQRSFGALLLTMDRHLGKLDIPAACIEEGRVVEEDVGDVGGRVVGVVLTVFDLLFLVLIRTISLVESLLV